MKKTLLTVSMAILLSACGEHKQAAAPNPSAPAPAPAPEATAAAHAAPPVADKAALTASAQAAISAFSGALKGELEAAMKAGGPVEALGVCKAKSPEIAKAVSAAKGMQVARTSLKPRNPNNAPTDWQKTVLEGFETRKAAGEDPATLAYSGVVGNEFRFMKAIPTGTLCLSCHGTNISPAVTAKLATMYPQDKAVGFKEGDLRGAFVVVKNLAQ